MKTLSKNSLVSLQAAAELIERGAILSVAGTEALLDQLPAGKWIGGTSSYFMADEGGVKSSDQLFVTHLPAEGPVHFTSYESSRLQEIMTDAPANGFSFAIVPAGSKTLQLFSEGSRFWPEIFVKPVVGWVAGIDLSNLGKQTAKVYNGSTGTKREDGMVVAHVALPANRIATLETVNIFERDPGDVIRFAKTCTETVDCSVNGKAVRLADFLAARNNADGKLPLVGDFAGASVNVSVQSVDKASGLVKLYAPVFSDVEYGIALPVTNYEARFAKEIARFGDQSIAFSCNCILNFLYGALEGKRTGHLTGPVTFGEIAYLLHNQTLVVLRIE